MIKWVLVGFIFIFFILNILTGFYLTKFLKKFILAIPLFVRDLVGMDREVFRGYGFWCFCGLGGSGKTLTMVNKLIALKEKYPKVKIFTNFTFLEADGKIDSWRDLLDTTNYSIEEITEKDYKRFIKYKTYSEDKGEIWQEVTQDGELKYMVKRNHGVVFGFDEIHLTFESTKWEDAPSNLLDYISQQRKFHKLILATSQVFTRIDKKLREQTNYVIECKSYLLGRLITNKYFDTATYISNGEKMDRGARKRRARKREVFVANDGIRSKYNTSEIMKELNCGKSDNSKLADLLSKYQKGE